MEIMELEKVKELVKVNELKHIAIIMDGNRRWAKEKGLPSAFGHKKGVDALKNTVRNFDKFGIEYITVYAFSTENWNRKQEEVKFLMDLVKTTMINELKELYDENVVIKFIGDMTKLKPDLVEVLRNAEEKTSTNTGVKLNIALNYGSRDEIVHAVKNIVNKAVSAGEITEELITNELYTKGIPMPDLLVRTGGEMRISNYLLWQIAYSEFYVTKKYWPEFDENALVEAIVEFNSRNRRFGV